MSLGDLIKEQYYLLRLRQRFRKCHGYRLDLENPKSYNEKIVLRKIYDRNPLFPILSDKYRARKFVIERLGEKVGGEIPVPLLFVTENPEDIPFDELPEEYIVKPNHGSGWSIMIDSSHKAEPGEIVARCRKWLGMTYGERYMEWAYSQVKPLIMVEKLLKDSRERLAPDFKFYVFHGTVQMVYVLHDRFGTPSEAFTTGTSGGFG